MRKPQKKTFLIIILLIVSLSYLFYWWYHQITPIGAVLTEKDIIHDLKVMDREKVDIYHVGIFDLSPLFISDFPDLAVGEGKFISLATRGKKLLYNEPYIEVKEAMNAWLYLMERKPPDNIVGIRAGFEIKGVISGTTKGVSKKEFERLYKQVDPDLSREQLIEELTRRWVELRGE